MDHTSQAKPMLAEETQHLQLYVTRVGTDETFLVVNVLPGQPVDASVRSAYRWISIQLHDAGMETVQERIFASRSVSGQVLDARRDVLEDEGVPSSGPRTYVEGSPPWGEGMAGILIHAVASPSESSIWTIRSRETPCGRGWTRDGATYLLLQDIHGLIKGPASVNTPPIQTWRMIERAEEVLQEQGATYAQVARTWFYLSDILDWYDDFNRVRSEKYRSFHLMPAPGREDILLPASTGISGDNLHGAAAVMDLLAVIPGDTADVRVEQLSNPRQKDAVRYGSAFSRGARLSHSTAGTATIQLSGTAAIDTLGESLYPEDIRSQIDCTLDTIEALLEPQGAGLSDIAAATVFVKRPEDAAVFHRIAMRRGIEPFPAVTVLADICRSELLFEIDAEVVYNPAASG